jgi:hypothetical protein
LLLGREQILRQIPRSDFNPVFTVRLTSYLTFYISQLPSHIEMGKEHSDIRWNPDLKEWFCAQCGVTSDHEIKQDAIREMATFECGIVAARASKLGEKERLLRAHYLTQRQKGSQ